jgi:glycosyltransferase involved in cell wall biosynthesis
VVLVPCAWNQDGFQASGVKAPIRLQPLGIDPSLFWPRGPHPLEPVIFGTAGRMLHGGIRKGIQDVITAFAAAFPDRRSPARLKVKIWPDDPPVNTYDHPGIEVLRDPLTHEGIADWYRSLSVYVSASRAEGYGLQPLQAMACGRPVLAGFHSGHLEYLDEACAWRLPCHLTPVAQSTYGGIGEWYEPDIPALVEILRDLARAPDSLRDKGRAAAAIAARKTWDQAGAILLNTLDEFGIRPRPRPQERAPAPPRSLPKTTPRTVMVAPAPASAPAPRPPVTIPPELACVDRGPQVPSVCGCWWHCLRKKTAVTLDVCRECLDV